MRRNYLSLFTALFFGLILTSQSIAMTVGAAAQKGISIKEQAALQDQQVTLQGQQEKQQALRREKALQPPRPSLEALAYSILLQSMSDYCDVAQAHHSTNDLQLLELQVKGFNRVSTHNPLPYYFSKEKACGITFGVSALSVAAFNIFGLPIAFALMFLMDKYDNYDWAEQDHPFSDDPFYNATGYFAGSKKLSKWMRECRLVFKKSGQARSVKCRLTMQLADGIRFFKRDVNSAQDGDEVPMLTYAIDKFEGPVLGRHSDVDELKDLKKALIYGSVVVKRHEGQLFVIHHAVNRIYGANRVTSFIQAVQDIKWLVGVKDCCYNETNRLTGARVDASMMKINWHHDDVGPYLPAPLDDPTSRSLDSASRSLDSASRNLDPASYRLLEELKQTGTPQISQKCHSLLKRIWGR